MMRSLTFGLMMIGASSAMAAGPAAQCPTGTKTVFTCTQLPTPMKTSGGPLDAVVCEAAGKTALVMNFEAGVVIESVTAVEDDTHGSKGITYSPATPHEAQYGLGVFETGNGKNMAFVTDLKNQTGPLNGIVGALGCK
jgi:hypothetical protein